MSRRPIILVPAESATTSLSSAATDGGGFGHTDGRWRLAGGSADAANWTLLPEDDLSATAVAAALRQGEYAGRQVVLALPSEWCLSANISTANLPKQGHQAMLYRFEERLPLAAEAIVAGFTPSPSGETALGICVATDRVQPLVQSLEEAGVSIAAIAPLSLLVLLGLDATPSTTGSERLVVLRTSVTGGVDICQVRDGRPVGWVLAADDTDDVVARLGWLAPTHNEKGITLELLGLESSAVAAVTSAVAPVQTLTHSLSTAAAAVAGAQSLLAGEAAGLDLRHGALAPADRLRSCRTSLRLTAAAAVVLLSAIAVAAFIRASRYVGLADSAQKTVLAEMQSAFPASLRTASVEDVRAMLAQEKRSWSNTQNSQAALSRAPDAFAKSSFRDGGGDEPGSALQTLGNVIGLIPVEGGIQIDRTMFDESSFELTGRARSYGDLDNLTSAIRTGKLEVSSPLARRGVDGTWTFTLRGTIDPATTTR